MAGPLSPSLLGAAAKRLIAPEAARQGALNLLRDTARQGRVAQQVIRGPRGEMYLFPSESTQAERATWDPIREAIDRTFLLEKGRMPDRKTADSSRLADAIQRSALPRSRSMPATIDALSARLDSPGTRADAVSAWSTTGNPNLMFLNDLVANPKVPGAGYQLLKDNLEGPLMPDASQVIFTPLAGARDFYKNKFGARLLTPQEAVTDPAYARAIGELGQHQNLDDLGLGVIERAEGGVVRMGEGGSPGANMTEWNGDRGMSLNEWAQKMLPSPTWNKKAQEDVGTEALTSSLPVGKIAAWIGKALPSAAVAGAALGSGNAEAGGKTTVITSFMEDLLANARRIHGGAIDLLDLGANDFRKLVKQPAQGDLVYHGNNSPLELSKVSPEKPLFVATRPGHAAQYAAYGEGGDPALHIFSAPNFGKLPYFPERYFAWDPVAEEVARFHKAQAAAGGFRSRPGQIDDYAVALPRNKNATVKDILLRNDAIREHSWPQAAITDPGRHLIKRADGGPVHLSEGGLARHKECTCHG